MNQENDTEVKIMGYTGNVKDAQSLTMKIATLHNECVDNVNVGHPHYARFSIKTNRFIQLINRCNKLSYNRG